MLHRSQIEIQQKRSARLDPISAPFVALPLEDNAKKQLTHKRAHRQAIIKSKLQARRSQEEKEEGLHGIAQGQPEAEADAVAMSP